MWKAIAVTKVIGAADPWFSWIRGSYLLPGAIAQPLKRALVAASTIMASVGDDLLDGLRQEKFASARHRAKHD